MTVEIGHFALVVAFAIALAQAIVPALGARLRDPAMMAVGTGAALTQFALVAISFARACQRASDVGFLGP